MSDRKEQIAKMSRKELNANAYHLEKEQEEYEATINQLRRELKHSQDNMIVAVSSIEYWQADAKRLDVSNISKQGFIDQQSKEYAEERAAHNSHVTELLQVEAVAKIAVKALEEIKNVYNGGITSRESNIATHTIEEIKRLEGVKP